MAGSLVKIAETTVTSAVASVTLTGIDSSYDVYMVKINNWIPATDNVLNYARVTVSGTPDTTANYDKVFKVLKTDTTFGNNAFSNATAVHFNVFSGNDTGENTNAVLYLFHFNNSSEYSSATVEFSGSNSAGNNHGAQGGFVHTVAQACDGIQFYHSSGNIDNGTFTLYGLKKS